MEELLNALTPLIEVVDTNDTDTLSRLAPDNAVIWTAMGSWSRDVVVTLGDLRKIAQAYHAIRET